MSEVILDLSDVIETFDVDETARLIEQQLSMLHDDVCDGMIDNFKLLYTRYADIHNNTGFQLPDVIEEVESLFMEICETFINMICDEFGISMDEVYLDNHRGDLPSIALAFYLFFVLNFRSNLYHVLLTYIQKHMTDIVSQFESMRQKRDSVTEVNRSLQDQNIALVASNAYDVVDWALDQMEDDEFFECMEQDYVALDPIRTFYEKGYLSGTFIVAVRNLLHENISMKGRICFDLICKLKGYEL